MNATTKISLYNLATNRHMCINLHFLVRSDKVILHLEREVKVTHRFFCGAPPASCPRFSYLVIVGNGAILMCVVVTRD